MESRYVAKYDKRHAEEGSMEGAGNLGFRTRFILADGTSIGTFSNGAHYFFGIIAALFGGNPEDGFSHLEFDGTVNVGIKLLQLDAKRSTYEFEIIEEGSTFDTARSMNAWTLMNNSGNLMLHGEVAPEDGEVTQEDGETDPSEKENGVVDTSENKDIKSVEPDGITPPKRGRSKK
ncbi:hypothetical protein D3C73_957540 [compost metagenome]